MWECNNPAVADAGLNVGDPAILIYFEGDDISSYPAACVKYRADTLFNADGTYRNAEVQYIYPTLKKFDDTTRLGINDPSFRPFIVARLAETYLVAAEALIMQGKQADAVPYIKAIRDRAAYRSSYTPTELAAARAAIQVTAGELDIDFILDERARELYGEIPRYLDLIRTKKLVERVQAHNPRGAANVQAKHLIRPIPQSQIDLMNDPTYQNEEWR
jgi:hypothetical protein